VKKRPWLLFASIVLFSGWIGWLIYLAATKRQMIVVSRPQLLACEFAVVADLGDRTGPVVVDQVYLPRENKPEVPELKGQQIEVTNLERCSGYTRPGKYLLALVSNPDDKSYHVVPTPHSPGYFPSPENVLRIYPDTPDTRWQISGLLEPR
jgi:hypothetical protein